MKKCDFCEAENIELVATLKADTDQLVCKACHDDPRIDTERLTGPESDGTTTYIDFTPPGCKTPEGNARVNEAIEAFAASSAEVANAASHFFDNYQVIYEDDDNAKVEDYQELQALIADRRSKQEEFLRAVSGMSRAKAIPESHASPTAPAVAASPVLP